MQPHNDVLLEWSDQIDPGHTALLMVDLQNDFARPNGL